jgi:hypothetical protein
MMILPAVMLAPWDVLKSMKRLPTSLRLRAALIGRFVAQAIEFDS